MVMKEWAVCKGICNWGGVILSYISWIPPRLFHGEFTESFELVVSPPWVRRRLWNLGSGPWLVQRPSIQCRHYHIEVNICRLCAVNLVPRNQ